MADIGVHARYTKVHRSGCCHVTIILMSYRQFVQRNLVGIESLSAAGIGELVGLRSRLRDSGGRLVLVNVGGHARRAIEEARLADVLGVCCGTKSAGDEGGVAGGGVWEACGKA